MRSLRYQSVCRKLRVEEIPSGALAPDAAGRQPSNLPARKARAAQAGLDPAEFSGHSLRAGFITSSAETGASILKIQEVSRHRSVDVLSGYVRRVDLFKDHAGAGFL
jgi:integrase